jgi:hypothetical protein
LITNKIYKKKRQGKKLEIKRIRIKLEIKRIRIKLENIIFDKLGLNDEIKNK